MSWLKEQNRQARQFCRGELGHFLYITTAAFCALIVLSLILGLAAPELCRTMLQRFARQVQDMGIQHEDGSFSALMLFFNNIRASFWSILYGFIPFLYLPALSLGINGSLLGLFAAYYIRQDLSLRYYLAGVVPHGIFELPALILALALGLYLCRCITDYVRRNTKGTVLPALKQILRAFLLRVLPLLMAASVMEAYVTPAVLRLLS